MLCNHAFGFFPRHFSRVQSDIFVSFARTLYRVTSRDIVSSCFVAAEFFSDAVREQFPSRLETRSCLSALLCFFDLKLWIFCTYLVVTLCFT